MMSSMFVWLQCRVAHCLFAFLLLVFASGHASAGILDDGISFVKVAGKTLERSYQQATKPVRDASHTIYKNTIRSPFNRIKREVNDAIPVRLKFIYKDNIERRFRPATDFWWDALTGRKLFSEATKEAVDSYVEQAKELLIPLELYLLYQSAKAASDPLPSDLLNIIAPHWSKLTRRDLHREALYLVSSELVDILSVGNAEAITFYDVVAFRRPLSNAPARLALLAHEMVHVDQYHDLSFMGFAAKYYIGGKLRTGRRNPLERQAYELEERMLARLSRPRESRTYHAKRTFAIPKSSSIRTLAAASGMGGDEGTLIPLAISKAIARGSKKDITQLAATALAAPQISDSARAEVCRIIASGRARAAFSPQQALDYGRLSVHFEPEETINWYFLAMSASHAGDIQTEYEALVRLSSMMIEQELRKRPGGRLTPRMRGAEVHLNHAAALGEQIGWRQGFVYDNRLPFILLVSIGLELRPNWWDDNAMLGYANRGIAIDAAIRKLDRWHFNLIDVTTHAAFRAGANMRNPILLQQCMNDCLKAHREYMQLSRVISGVPTDFGRRMQYRAAQVGRLLYGR